MEERDLSGRVAELERRCGRLQAALGGALALGAAAWLAGARAPEQEVLRARGFELVDAGQVHGRLAFDGASPVLELYHHDPEGQASVALRAGPGPRGRAVFEELGSASLVLRSASGSARLLAGANAIPGQDQRQLLLLEGHGPRALLVAGSDHLGVNGEPPAAHPFATLDLRSEPGSATSTMPSVRLLATERTGTLELGTGQTPRAVLRYQDGEPSLSLQNAAGTSRFRAP